MSRDKDCPSGRPLDRRSKESLRARLDALQRLLEAGATPPGFEQLFHDLAPAERLDPAHEGEEEAMLAVLISEALDGVDIARRYPHFFKRLLVDAGLRAAFLESLEALEGDHNSAREALPLPPSRDLSFLKKVQRATPDKVETASGGWTMRWRRSAQDIAGLFSFLSADLQPGYRSTGGFLEDETVTLLRGRVTSRTMELDVTLEATRPAAQPDELHLGLWILPVDEGVTQVEDLSLLATVQWAAYEAQVEITGDGYYTLPARKLEDVVDDTQRATADLHITVQDKR